MSISGRDTFRLSQTMIRLFDCGRPITTHIDKKKSKCDYLFSRPLAEDELMDIEKRVNEVIRADSPVDVFFLSVRDAEKNHDLEQLPEGVDDRIRIVRIGNYDASPCIGAHVESTGAIGRFRIASSTHENGVLRIRYKLERP
jgi:alanyl-tRNA synthetase